MFPPNGFLRTALADCRCRFRLHDAARTGAVGLCGMNNETIPDAETVLPKNLCPLIKGTYGFAPSPVAICKSIARSCRPTRAASSI
ncbi:2-hydroxyacyl-CoA dehydratase family protein [Eggerthella sp. AM16-19]|uniref:2-hydroxyacyl-CoA dehydratase family protein n=1 Tax=Eggerthella sp. AM16-19 TaxID=2292042 RepID=UPI00336BBC16